MLRRSTTRSRRKSRNLKLNRATKAAARMSSAICCSRWSTWRDDSRSTPNERSAAPAANSNAGFAKLRLALPPVASIRPKPASTRSKPNGRPSKPRNARGRDRNYLRTSSYKATLTSMRAPNRSPALCFHQQIDQTRGVPAATAPLLDALVELIDQGGHRQRRFVAPRLVQTDAEILAHPVDREAEIELAVEHGERAVIHLPGLRRAF